MRLLRISVERQIRSQFTQHKVDVTFMGIIEVVDETNKGKLFAVEKPSYLDKSRREGEKDLVALSTRVGYEVTWNYLPQTSRWVSLPSVTFDGVINGVNVKGTRLHPIRDEDKKIISPQILYHTHPRSALEEPTGNPVFDSFYHVIGLSMLALPSSADLYLSSEYPDLEHKIASPSGITRYQLRSDDIALPFMLMTEHTQVQLAKDFVGAADVHASIEAMARHLKETYPVDIDFEYFGN